MLDHANAKKQAANFTVAELIFVRDDCDKAADALYAQADHYLAMDNKAAARNCERQAGEYVDMKLYCSAELHSRDADEVDLLDPAVSAAYYGRP